MTGRPDTTDPLDRIEDRLAAAREDVATRPFSHPIGIGWYAEDVPALVALARAARDMRDSAEIVINGCDTAHLELTLGPLSEALARLDGAR